MKTQWFRYVLYSIIVCFSCAAFDTVAEDVSATPENHNVMLKVEYVERDRVTFASLDPTLDIKLRESEVLKYYEVIIWEDSTSVHFYEFPNDFDSRYGYDITNVSEDGTPSIRRNNITDEQIIAYREQFLISKYSDMPRPWNSKRSSFLKLVFTDIASHLVNRHPASDHHLKYRGHGGPGGRLFHGFLEKNHAHEVLESWTQLLGKPLGVIDMGGPCNKGSFADIDNFSDYSRYYVASDLVNGGYTMDDFTWSKRDEVWPLTQYHSLFSANRSLEEVLKGRIDLKRKDYEYSRNNMIGNRVAQGNYLYSCAAFRRFSPNFKAFLVSADVDYRIWDDLYQYMIDNKAPLTLIKQFNDVFVHSTDNKDFFEWSEVANGMLMPDEGLLNQLRQTAPQTLEKISDSKQQGAPGTQLTAPFVVEVRNRWNKPLKGVQVTFTITAGGGSLSTTSTETDANGRAETTLTLGPKPGTNTVTASVAGIQKQRTFSAVGIRIPKTLKIVSGDDQEGVPGTALENPFVVEVRDRSGGTLPGVEVTFSVSSGGGTLSATSVTTNANGRAQSTLTLGPTPGTNTVKVTASGIDQTVTFSGGQVVAAHIPDLNLRAAIAAALGKPHSAVIGQRSMAALTDLEARNANVSDLTGLEGATNLKTLALYGEYIEAENRWVNNNSVSDVSPLAGLTRLTSLNLHDNNISDISPLVENAGLGSGDSVVVGANPLSYPSIYTHIPALQERGVEVIFHNRAPQRIRIVSGNNQQGLPRAVLEKPLVVEVQDERSIAFEGVPVTFTVTTGNGELSVVNTTTDENGRAESMLTLGPSPGTNTVNVSATEIEEQQAFTAEAIRLPLAFWIIIGDKQQGLVGSALANPFVVEVRGHAGEPFLDAQVTFTVTSGGGTLSVTSVTTDANGRAESTLTLGPNQGTNTVAVSVKGIPEKQTVSAIAELPPIPEDVNRDDVVDILDLVLVASVLGETGQDLMADVNGDGIVNILDLVLVAGALGNAAAAPSMNAQALKALSASEAGRWLAQAGELDLTDPVSREGVLYLEQLLAALTPKRTALLPNYPNPFNPETWIPYQLSEDADVMLTIYDTNGIIVRRVDLGHRVAGYYAEREKAAYWDGRNEFGEGVASGVYVYHLSAGEYSAARKMLVVK